MQESASLIPPNAPVPEPTRWGADKIPVLLIGIGLFIYLCYLLGSEVIDQAGFFSEKEPSPVVVLEENGSTKNTDPHFFSHPEIDEPAKCIDCHFPRIEEKPDFDLIAPDDSEQRKKGFPLISGETGEFRGAGICLQCHTIEDFTRQHFGHEFAALESCTMCHRLHQTGEKSLLLAPQSLLCGMCHSPDRLKLLQ